MFANERHDQKLYGRDARVFIYICMLVYMTSYLTRINYGAVIPEIITSLSITKKAAGFVSTVAFITYGSGQILSGIVGDRVKPHLLIIFGLMSTSIFNLAMIFISDAVIMTLVWGINGLCQAMFWPPLLKLMVENLNSEDYSRACILVMVGSSMGTIVIYLTSPVFILLSGWKLVFIVSASCGILMSLLWMTVTKKINLNTTVIEKKANDTENQKACGAEAFGRDAIIILMMICCGIVLQGILRDGITTWMPTFLSEKFNLSSSVSILTGVVLPVFSFICVCLATRMQKKWNNELICSLILFSVGTVSALLLHLFAFGESNGIGTVGFSVLMMSVLTGCMHGINLMLVVRVPAYFNKYGKVSTVSGIVNAFTYVGSAISGYCFAALSEQFGWGTTVCFWTIIALLGVAVCLLCARKWSDFKRMN